MNNKLIWGALAVVIVVALGGYVLLSNKSTAPATQDNTQTQTQTETPVAESPVVNVTAAGFEPNSITVKAGTTVTWTNKSGATANVSSDVHPTHLLFPFLNLGNFDDGSSVSVMFEKAGTYTYHNHLNTSQTGTVVVK